MAREEAPLVAVVDENRVLLGVVRADGADGDGSLATRMEPAAATVPVDGKLQDALAKVLLTDTGWVAVVDGAQFVGALTPESVFRSLRRSITAGSGATRIGPSAVSDPCDSA